MGLRVRADKEEMASKEEKVKFYDSSTLNVPPRMQSAKVLFDLFCSLQSFPLFVDSVFANPLTLYQPIVCAVHACANDLIHSDMLSPHLSSQQLG